MRQESVPRKCGLNNHPLSPEAARSRVTAGVDPEFIRSTDGGTCQARHMPTDGELDDDTEIHSFNGGFTAFDLNLASKIVPQTHSLSGVRV